MTDQPLSDTWHSRELPVLRECARLLELDDTMVGVRLAEVAAAVTMDPETVLKSLMILQDAGYVELRLVMPATAGRVVKVSPRARQVVGQWPTEETALDRIIAALEAIAENTDDEDTRTRARKVLDGLTGAGRQIGISVAAAALTGQIPGQ